MIHRNSGSGAEFSSVSRPVGLSDPNFSCSRIDIPVVSVQFAHATCYS